MVERGVLPRQGLPPVEIADPRNPEHGDFATNFALAAAKAAGAPPRDVAIKLQEELASEELFAEIEIAGPGFINFRLQPTALSGLIPAVIELGARLGQSNTQNPKRINVEFVSVNPNGPITVGSGRGAAFGSALCNVLAAAGHQVHREYYINDGINSEQMRLFAESVRAYGESLPFPEKGYKGEYVKEIADRLQGTDAVHDLDWYRTKGQEMMIERQRGDLAAFGVEFDTWFSEQSLHDRGEVAARVDELERKEVADERPYRTKVVFDKSGSINEASREDQPVEDEDETGPSDAAVGATLWLRSTKFGDDMDRVLRRKDGRLTYIASDVAYHRDKFSRPSNGDKLITILGPDHHGYIGRLHAVLAALLEEPITDTQALEPLSEAESLVFVSPEEREACRKALQMAREKLDVVIYQIVRFMKDGKPAPMRKRDGNIYELRDLIIELGKAAAPNAPEDEQMRIGRDVARFFYLMRSHDTHMDFDIDLATKQSDENPVFYVQYAHARICSVIKKAEEAGFTLEGKDLKSLDLSPLVHPRELALIKKLLDLPYEVQRCAEDYKVHRLTTYAIEVARTYHHFYDACRVIQPDQPDLTLARLALCHAAQAGLKSTFKLLGISAPERMDREQAQ
jgi:arginyl-tRNA synthetase